MPSVIRIVGKTKHRHEWPWYWEESPDPDVDYRHCYGCNARQERLRGKAKLKHRSDKR